MSFWKFVKWDVPTTFEQASAFACKIKAGEAKAKASDPGGRLYKVGGWCFDLAELAGFKPYLVEHSYGGFSRGWAKSVADLREAMYLSRKDRVALDPFVSKDFALSNMEDDELAEA